MSERPDVAEPALGFRAWLLPDRRRTLRPATYTREPWQPGPNQAVCHALAFRRGTREPPHAAPDGGCQCGLYAFHDIARLTRGLDRHLHCAGVVAGWGEVELHDDGFRAEWATVLALAGDTTPGPARRLLAATAARYGVPLVPFAGLEAYGREFARPLRLPVPSKRPPERSQRRPRPGTASARFHLPADLRYLPEAHVWARWDGDVAAVGVAAPLREVIAWTPAFEVWPVTEVRAGELLATVATKDGGVVALPSPVSGEVVRVNRLAREVVPHLLRTMPYGHGWLVRIRPDDWSRDSRRLVPADRYAASLDRALGGGEPLAAAFGAITRPPRRGPPPGPPRRAAPSEPRPPVRHPPAFPSAAALHERLGGFLSAQLPARPGLELADVAVEFRHTDPEATIVVDLRPGRPAAVHLDAAPVQPDAALAMTGDLAHAFWRGELDVPAALARGEIALEGSREAALRCVSVLQSLFAPYRTAGAPPSAGAGRSGSAHRVE